MSITEEASRVHTEVEVSTLGDLSVEALAPGSATSTGQPISSRNRVLTCSTMLYTLYDGYPTLYYVGHPHQDLSTVPTPKVPFLRDVFATCFEEGTKVKSHLFGGGRLLAETWCDIVIRKSHR